MKFKLEIWLKERIQSYQHFSLKRWLYTHYNGEEWAREKTIRNLKLIEGSKKNG
jgi:hypothetical protein